MQIDEAHLELFEGVIEREMVHVASSEERCGEAEDVMCSCSVASCR